MLRRDINVNQENSHSSELEFLRNKAKYCAWGWRDGREALKHIMPKLKMITSRP